MREAPHSLGRRGFLTGALGAAFLGRRNARAASSSVETSQLMDISGREPALVLQDFVLSPNGRIVAFEYRDLPAGRNSLGLGFLYWETGRLVRIPNPPSKQLSMPSFSENGRHLVAAMGGANSLEPSQIGVIDVDTLEVTEITPVPTTNKDFPFKEYPVCQPSTGDILYVLNINTYGPHHLQLLHRSSNTTTTILDPKYGFYAIFRPSFVGPEEVVFQAIAPRDPALIQPIIDLLGREHYNVALTITYRLRFGETPEIFLPALTKARTSQLLPGLAHLTASRNGETIIFEDFATLQPEGAHGEWNYEIFKLQNGQVTQMTDLRSYLAFAHVSYDGGTVAFGSDPTRRKIVDLLILDVSSRKITATGLLNRLQTASEFRLG